MGSKVSGKSGTLSLFNIGGGWGPSALWSFKIELYVNANKNRFKKNELKVADFPETLDSDQYIFIGNT